jgi:hypothetical protein
LNSNKLSLNIQVFIFLLKDCLGLIICIFIGSSADVVSHQSSGLYVFRPVGVDPPKPVPIKEFYCYKVRLKSSLIDSLINHFFIA